MKISKEEEIKLMEMIVDLDKQIKRLKIRRKNYKEQLEAINYTNSCTELKDKKAMTFEEYLEDNDLSQTYIWLSRQVMTDSASKIHRDWQLTLDPNL